MWAVIYSAQFEAHSLQLAGSRVNTSLGNRIIGIVNMSLMTSCSYSSLPAGTPHAGSIAPSKGVAHSGLKPQIKMDGKPEMNKSVYLALRVLVIPAFANSLSTIITIL